MTADPWLPGANRVPGPHAVGLAMAGGECLLTHHITVSGKESFATTRDYLVSEAYEPTLLLDAWHGHRAQFLPATRGAYALRHPAGAPETNREGRIHIQVEWLCPDMSTDLTHAPFFAEQWYDLCVWSHELGVPYTWPFGSPLAGSRDPRTWRKGGHRGHRNAPGNDHVDSLPARTAPAWPTPKPPAPHPHVVTTEVDMFLIEAANDPAIYVVEAKGKRHVTPDEYAVYSAAGVKKVDVTAKQRDAIPNL